MTTNKPKGYLFIPTASLEQTKTLWRWWVRRRIRVEWMNRLDEWLDQL